MQYAERLNELVAEGWRIMAFSFVKPGLWQLSARHERSYSWTTYEHPNLDVLIKAFLDDHPPESPNGGVVPFLGEKQGTLL